MDRREQRHSRNWKLSRRHIDLMFGCLQSKLSCQYSPVSSAKPEKYGSLARVGPAMKSCSVSYFDGNMMYHRQ